MNLIKKFLTQRLGAVILSVAVVLGLSVGAPAVARVVSQPQPPSSSVLPAGPQSLGVVIRLYDTGPEFHLDDDHWESGIDVSQDPEIDASGYLVIHTKEKNAVISCEASPDETLVARGITAGCSNGSYLVRFRLVKIGLDGQPAPLDLNNPVHYSRVSGEFSNLWVNITHNGSWTP